MELNFVLNNFRLIVHTLASYKRKMSPEYQKEIVAFLNYAWSLSQNCCMFIDGRSSVMSSFDSQADLSQFCTSELTSFFAELEQSKEFIVLRDQTSDSMVIIEEQWNRNICLTSIIIQSLTGFDLNKTMMAYITHPGIANGKYLGNNILMWRHREDWYNYTTVYLWHEILHSYFGYSDLEHALIELITDNELRIRLNGGVYPPFVGHRYLEPLKEKLSYRPGRHI